MSIAFKIHNDTATFSNSITKRQFAFVTANIKLTDNGGGNGTLHVDCGQGDTAPDRTFEMTASLEECTAAFEALAEWNELRSVTCQSSVELWDIDVVEATGNVYNYPKA